MNITIIELSYEEQLDLALRRVMLRVRQNITAILFNYWCNDTFSNNVKFTSESYSKFTNCTY